MEATSDQIERLKRDLELIAKEQLLVEQINDIFYIQGSELACLRLEHKYNNPKCRAQFSQNLKTWVFSIGN